MKLTYKKVHENDTQRFYRLSHKLTKGLVSIYKDLAAALDKERLKPEYVDKVDKTGVNLICVSDAHTHAERLVFAATDVTGSFSRLGAMLAGCWTMMIYGGDPDTMRPDEEYIHDLAIENGFDGAEEEK